MATSALVAVGTAGDVLAAVEELPIEMQPFLDRNTVVWRYMIDMAELARREVRDMCGISDAMLGAPSPTLTINRLRPLVNLVHAHEMGVLERLNPHVPRHVLEDLHDNEVLLSHDRLMYGVEVIDQDGRRIDPTMVNMLGDNASGYARVQKITVEEDKVCIRQLDPFSMYLDQNEAR